MTTITEMRRQLIQAHMLGHDEDVRLISEIEGAPKDATEVFICYLALEAAKGDYDALAACEAIKEWASRESKESEDSVSTAFASLNLQTPTAKTIKKGGDVE